VVLTPSSVHLMENHDGAYYIWRDLGVKDRILVHIDAHHDMWWAEDTKASLVTIANFICPALKEGIVREVFWVVPDATWESARARRPVWQHVKLIAKGFSKGGPSAVIGMREGRLKAVLLGKPVTVCPLRLLPALGDDVLLDIDTDYLLIPRVTCWNYEDHSPVPWLWPRDLVKRLEEAGIRSTVRTVVYSVEGGYTPLKWKYLGDELAARLGGSKDSWLDGLEVMNDGARAEQRGEREAAARIYSEAARRLPDSAAPWFRLALLYADSGQTEEGRNCYREAVRRDSSYVTAYSSQGFHFEWREEPERSEQEHSRMLAIAPQDPYAYLGMARLAARKKKWAEAEDWLRQSIEAHHSLMDAYRILAKVLVQQKRYGEAIEAYERSLKLALAGARPIDLILTHPAQHVFLDPEHSLIHARLARLYSLTGADRKAVTGFRISIGAGCDFPVLRFRLARVYFRQKHAGKAAAEIWAGVRRLPVTMWRACRRWVRRTGLRLGTVLLG